MTVWPVLGTALAAVVASPRSRLFVGQGGGKAVRTRDAVDPENALSTSKVPREWQSPLLFFAVVLALWVAMWCGVYLLV